MVSGKESRVPRWSLTTLASRLRKLREPIKRVNRNVGLFVACALLLMVGSLAMLAHGGTPGSTHPVSRQSANTTGTAADSTLTEATEPGATPTHGRVGPPDSSPTRTPYTGPNYMHVAYDYSSCHPGAVSPYPYLDVTDTNAHTPLYWTLTLSDPTYTLYANPPNPIQPGPTWGSFFAFSGPMDTTAPLTVTFEGSIGNWSGVLQPCAVATPTFPKIPVTITCATTYNGSATLCIHTQPDVSLTADVVYCDGKHEPDLLGVTGPGSDAQGNGSINWTMHTTCYGMATATVYAGNSPIQGTATIQFMVNNPAAPTSTPAPTPPPTPTPTLPPALTPTPTP